MSQQHQHRGPMGRGMQMGGAKAKDFKGSFAKLLKYMGKYKVSFFSPLLLRSFTSSAPKSSAKPPTN